MTTTAYEKPKRPGVYVTEAPLSRIIPLSSSIGTYGCFMGTAVKGPMSPVYLSSMSEYYDIFGPFSWKKTLPAALSQYFANGGGPAFVCRVIDGTGGAAGTATATFDDNGGLVAITGVTAGAPGAFTPGTASLPANLAALKSHSVVGDGARAGQASWTLGQYVVLGDASQASWNGNAWVAGAAANITGVTAGAPGAFVPANSMLPATLAALNSHGAVGTAGTNKPGAAWAANQRVVIGDGSSATWNGSAWAVAAALREAEAKAATPRSRTKKAATKEGEPEINPLATRARMRIDAFSPGVWGNAVSYAITPVTQTLGAETIHTFTFDIYEMERGNNVPKERFSSLSTDPDDPRYFVSIINSATIGSRRVTVSDLTSASELGQPMANGSGPAPVPLIGGSDGDDAAITGSDYANAFDKFVDIEGLFLVNCPKVTDLAALEAKIVQRGDSVLIQDTAATDDLVAPVGPTGLSSLPTSSYGVSYYPWIYINDPAPGAARGSIVKVPPGASVCGMIVRTDTSRGVYKAPAGLTAGLVGAVAPVSRLSNDQLDDLAEMHVNAVRSIQGTGIMVMGARTRWFEDVAQFLSVRRTLNYIKRRSIQASRFALFEPNTYRLWEQLRVANGAFLSELWVEGGLRGLTQEEAFYVKIDSDNNTEQSMSNGELHIEIGVAPVFPAEYVLIRVGQFDGGSSFVIEEG